MISGCSMCVCIDIFMLVGLLKEMEIKRLHVGKNAPHAIRGSINHDARSFKDRGLTDTAKNE